MSCHRTGVELADSLLVGQCVPPVYHSIRQASRVGRDAVLRKSCPTNNVDQTGGTPVLLVRRTAGGAAIVILGCKYSGWSCAAEEYLTE